MLIDRYTPEDVFARVPELAEQTDPVLHRLDGLLDDDPLVAPLGVALATGARRRPSRGAAGGLHAARD